MLKRKQNAENDVMSVWQMETSILTQIKKNEDLPKLAEGVYVSNMAFRRLVRRLVLPGTLISFGSFVTFGFSTLQAKAEQGKSGRVARIAIIGSGIGGSSAAHFVRQILGPDAQIEVFERSDKVGGRLATIQVAGHVYEAGGSIIHPENMYMKSFVKDLGKEELVNLVIWPPFPSPPAPSPLRPFPPPPLPFPLHPFPLPPSLPPFLVSFYFYYYY